MDYGLYISASGALNAAYRQDLFAGNLANANTVGYKPLLSAVRQRDPARVEDGLMSLPSNDLLEQLSAGVMGNQTRINFAQGSLRPTGNDLDMAIRGKGFFVLLDEQDKSGNRLRLSRDGRFTLGPDRKLISVTNGMPVAGRDSRPIRLASGAPITVRSDGAILQRDQVVGRLDLAMVDNPASLKNAGAGLYIADQVQMAGKKPATGTIVQRAIEESGVNEITTLMQMQSAAGAARTNLGMLRYHDRVLDQAINRFARVA